MQTSHFLKFSLWFLFLLQISRSYGQDAYVDPNKPKIRYAYFELAGSGGLASLNYETPLNPISRNPFYFRAAFSYSPIDKNNGGVLVFPVMIHYRYGNSSHQLDFGIGQSFSLTTKGNIFLLMPVSLGYRYDRPDHKSFWRFSYTPLISYLVDFQWQHWGGISWGFKF